MIFFIGDGTLNDLTNYKGTLQSFQDTMIVNTESLPTWVLCAILETPEDLMLWKRYNSGLTLEVCSILTQEMFDHGMHT